MLNRVVRKSARASLIFALAAILASSGACNNSLGGFSGAVGKTPKVAPVASFKILGTEGEAFSAVVSNKTSSWQISGNVPMDVAIVNNLTPDRMVATKQSSDNGILSVQLINGAKVIDVASTTQPFGVVSVQSGKPRSIAPAANPDLRIFVSGPAGERFSALIEDLHKGFVVDDRAPALFLFDSPNGTVTGTFDQIQNFGAFEISMFLNGELVATATGAPHVVIQQP
ncbi:MAG: hypothetical protein Q7S58_19170 [Candidatus Binatus sp.]|uniref:hypothetical protein n=1 Tax=Candidatus Binatus sp. TaxID=2811406 RepID=UPI00271A139A|nr:hypothetical protein [Candidatus Binatus sp.]MDO8434523.1 hypothetical protein [Candidatus Binatus sp.]